MNERSRLPRNRRHILRGSGPTASCRCTAIALTLASSLAFAQFAPAQEGSASLQVEATAWTLDAFLERFLTVDPSVSRARLEAAIAAVAVAQSRDRLGAQVNVSAPVGYELLTAPGLGAFHLGTASIAAAEAVVEDRLGGTARATLTGRLTTAPAIKPGGNTVGLRLAYAIPLWRNAGGRLFELETAFRTESEAALTLEAAALQRDRCAAGISSFLGAYVLQELAEVWSDLLTHKRRTLQQTERDYARRMVTRLDLLAAQSDWLLARQRFQAYEASRAQALTVLRTYLPPDSGPLRLAPSEAVTEALPSAVQLDALADTVREHPSVKALEHQRASTRAQQVWIERSYAPEIALVPELAVEHYSHIGGLSPAAAPTASLPLTSVFAGVGLSIALPLRVPAQKYQLQSLMMRDEQLELGRQELQRSLTERASVAAQRVQDANVRLELAAEKLSLAQGQIQEAGRMYANGKLEFQDYLVHWAAYEEARFARLELLSTRWAAQVELLRILGPLPSACRTQE